MFNLSPIAVPDLTGKTILVTGAGHGIGAVLVNILTGKGAKVYAGVFDRPDSKNAALLNDARVVDLDVTRQADVDAVIAKITNDTGTLDVLINNAGVIAPIGHLRDLDSADLMPAYAVNVMGMHRMIVAALPLLETSKGVVINAGTGAATTPMEGWTTYCCSKAGARMLTQMCAMELAETGLQFFFIGIPPTDTDMQAKIRDAGLNPISQIAQSDLVATDVPASVMAWLSCDDARSLTETILDVRDQLFTDMMAS